MKLIERYIYDVTRRLPERQRDDVGRELRVEIEAMVDDKAVTKKPTTAHVRMALMDLGDPIKLADQYLGRKRYIIGPLYYGMYLDLLKVLLTIIVPIIIFFTFTGRLVTVNEHFVGALFHAVGAGVEVGVHVFFWTTVSFALVERYIIDKIPEGRAWTPEQLPKLPGEQHISKGEAMLGMTWSVIAIWATAMQVPEIHQMFSSNVPLFFAPSMWPYWTLALLGISILSLGAEIMKLIVGGWTRSMVIVITIINLLVVTYFWSLIAYVKPVVNPGFSNLVAQLLGKTGVEAGMDIAVKVFVISVTLISLYEIWVAVRSYAMSKRRELK